MQGRHELDEEGHVPEGLLLRHESGTPVFE
jgi:hypothetical protein